MSLYYLLLEELSPSAVGSDLSGGLGLGEGRSGGAQLGESSLLGEPPSPTRSSLGEGRWREGRLLGSWELGGELPTPYCLPIVKPRNLDLLMGFYHFISPPATQLYPGGFKRAGGQKIHGIFTGITTILS